MGSYAQGQLKLLFVLCLFRHKKVTAWFMHLFCELDGNCLCFGAPDGSKHEIWKWNSVHELIYKVEQVLSCWIGSSWINTTLCVWVGRTCLSLPCPVVLRKMSVEANICKHCVPCLWSPLGKDIKKSACLDIFVWLSAHTLLHVSIWCWHQSWHDSALCLRHVFFNMAAHRGETQMGFDFLMVLDGHGWCYSSWQAAPYLARSHTTCMLFFMRIWISLSMIN